MHTCVIARRNVKVSDCNHGLPFQEEILKEMEQYLERHRSQFPRLYFLSNADLVEMVGISRNPQALVPFARKCFPGITSLTFTLPPGMGGLNSALDFALNSRQLFVFFVCVWGGGGFTGCGLVISVRAFLSCFDCLFVHLRRLMLCVWWSDCCCGVQVTSCRWWLSVVLTVVTGCCDGGAWVLWCTSDKLQVVTECCCGDGGDRVLLWWWCLSVVVH